MRGYQLSDIQIEHLRSLAEAGQYGLAYRFCADMVEEAVAQGDVERGMQRWFEWAEQINDHPDSLRHQYALNFSQLSALFDFHGITPDEFKAASDTIAAQVIERISGQGYIPAQADEIVIDDIMAGSKARGTDPEDFPGTLVADALFGVPALDTMILDRDDINGFEKSLALSEQVIKHGLLGASIAGLSLKGAAEGFGEILVDPSRILDVPDAVVDILDAAHEGLDDFTANGGTPMAPVLEVRETLAP